jgi:hypothetical protein
MAISSIYITVNPRPYWSQYHGREPLNLVSSGVKDLGCALFTRHKRSPLAISPGAVAATMHATIMASLVCCEEEIHGVRLCCFPPDSKRNRVKYQICLKTWTARRLSSDRAPYGSCLYILTLRNLSSGLWVHALTRTLRPASRKISSIFYGGAKTVRIK